jgi:hypothetical protein
MRAKLFTSELLQPGQQAQFQDVGGAVAPTGRRPEKSPRRSGRAPGGFELRGGPMLPGSPY